MLLQATTYSYRSIAATTAAVAVSLRAHMDRYSLIDVQAVRRTKGTPNKTQES